MRNFSTLLVPNWVFGNAVDCWRRERKASCLFEARSATVSLILGGKPIACLERGLDPVAHLQLL